MNKGKPSKHKTIRQSNPLESLKDIGGSVRQSIQKDLIANAPQDFVDQLFGIETPNNFSGEIGVGETVEIQSIIARVDNNKVDIRKRSLFERRIRENEKTRVERKTNELRIQLKVLMNEMSLLAESTQELAEETKIAVMQAPVEPGAYHLVFFEKIFEFIKSFRKKINEASVWLHYSNGRAQKKGYWASYKKHGAKFLLSGEHYISRSAG